MSRLRISLDPAELPVPAQIEAWKSMPPARKYELVRNAVRFVRNMKRSGIRAANPTWDKDQIERELARQWLHAGS
jgi:hypothetical protein